MGRSLYRTFQRIGILTAFLVYPTGNANALAVECAGCVVAIDNVQAAVNEGNAKLDTISNELATIKNYLNQIRLAIGPVETTNSISEVGQQTDFLNLPFIQPTADAFQLEEGQSIDFSNLTKLQKTMNDSLQIFTDAKELKSALETGNVAETSANIERIVKRRNNLVQESLQRLLTTSYYSLSQTEQAKSKEKSLESARTSAKTIQKKIAGGTKTQAELLSRINHLITLMGAQNSYTGAKHLKDLPRQIEGLPELQSKLKKASDLDKILGK